MSGLFGGRDPFDDPFFTRPFGSLFGSGDTFHDSPRLDKSKGPVIEELNSDGEVEEEEEDDVLGNCRGKIDGAQKNRNAYKTPLVEHPDDQADEGRANKDVSDGVLLHNKAERHNSQTLGVSFKRIAYGGMNGTYYTATTTRRTGTDGVVLEESKQADRTTGQATHRISRGIQDKGHSLTRKLNSDGKVDTMQTLHNLNEDELAGFENDWKGNAVGNLRSWNDDPHGNAGASGSVRNREVAWGGWSLPFTESFGRGSRSTNEARQHPSGGRPKTVVTINIE